MSLVTDKQAYWAACIDGYDYAEQFPIWYHEIAQPFIPEQGVEGNMLGRITRWAAYLWATSLLYDRRLTIQECEHVQWHLLFDEEMTRLDIIRYFKRKMSRTQRAVVSQRIAQIDQIDNRWWTTILPPFVHKEPIRWNQRADHHSPPSWVIYDN